MNELQIFNGEFGEVRMIMQDNEPWFVGKDVATALGYTNPQKAIKDHVDDEDRTVNDSFTVNGTMGILINESGLYSLIFASKLDSAKKFKRWVTSEVLPTIRKTGEYSLTLEDRKKREHERIRRVLRNMELVRAVMLKENLSPETIGDMMYQLCDQHDMFPPNFFIHLDKITRDDIIAIIKFAQTGKYKDMDPEYTYCEYLIANTNRRHARSEKLVNYAAF